jgi:hypothetical protein
MPRIAISYRREDSGVITGRIFDRLVVRYGRDAIFRDIDNIPIGVDFRAHVDQVLGASDVVLAVVGPQWMGPSALQSRLGDEADPVRVEIEAALRKGAPLIPVLVLGAAMPMASQLPESLKDFAYRNAIRLDAGQDFDVHISRLLRAMDRILGLSAEPAQESVGGATAVLAQPDPPKRHRMLIGGSIAAVLSLAVAAGWYFGVDRQKSLLPTEIGEAAPKVPSPPAVSPLSTMPASPVAATAPPPIDPEMVFWQSIAASTNSADFEEYLRRYPQGRFAGLARNRLAALNVGRPPGSPEAAFPSYAREVNVTRSATSGDESALAYTGSWNSKTCTAVPAVVTIAKPGSYGTARVVDAEEILTASTPGSGLTGSCAGKTIASHKIMYLSNPDFHGTDVVVYTTQSVATFIRGTITVVVP